MKRIYNKIIKIIKQKGEFIAELNTIVLDLENGVLMHHILTGNLKVQQCIKCDLCDLLSGETGFLNPQKTYYKNFDTPYCLKPDLKKLLTEIKK